jgi:hypothetical protein
MSAISGQLLGAKEFRDELRIELSRAKIQVTIASAYLKGSALAWAAEQSPQDVSFRVLARWQPGDLINGASDLEAYEIAAQRNWPFYVQEDFHGKAYLIDQHCLYIGSTNLTSRGLNLYENGNDEINVRAVASDENIAFVNYLFKRAILIRFETYMAIKNWLKEIDVTNADASISWPEAIAAQIRLAAPPNSLFVAECFQTDASWTSDRTQHLSRVEQTAASYDVSLLSLPNVSAGTTIEPALIAEKLAKTKIYAWLHERLKRSGTKELYFGELTAALHDSLVDDPAPFRSEVKTLVGNLLGWIARSEIEEFRVDRPNYSQRIALLPPTSK